MKEFTTFILILSGFGLVFLGGKYALEREKQRKPDISQVRLVITKLEGSYSPLGFGKDVRPEMCYMHVNNKLIDDYLIHCDSVKIGDELIIKILNK